MTFARTGKSVGLLLAVALLVVVALSKGALANSEPSAGQRQAVASAETGVATLAGSTRVTLNGAVTPSGTTVSYAFEYGTSEAYGQSTPEVQLSAEAPKTSVKAVVAGLSANVTYHYRLVAKTSDGVDTGRDRTFTTGGSARPPSASTLPAAGVGDDRATFVGRVNAGGQPTTYAFEWGPTVAYGSVTPAAGAGAGTTPVQLSTEVTGLKPGTTYHYRVVASNGAGTHRGGNRSFRTSSALTGITLVPSGTEIPWEGSVTLDGTVAGPAVGGVRVQLMRQDFPYRAAFRQVAAASTGADGRYRFRLRRLYASTRLKVQAGRSGVTSPVVSIGSQLYVRLRVERSRRASVRLSGRVYPARRNGRVRIERLSDEAEWVLVRKVKLQKRSRGRSGFRVTVRRQKQVAAYRAVIDPRDGGAHIDSPSTPVDIGGRR